MSRTSQTALERYQARRQGTTVPFNSPNRKKNNSNSKLGKSSVQRLTTLAVLCLVLGLVVWQTLPETPTPVRLSYEIDLQNASAGSLTITMIVEGELPEKLDLEFPRGVFGDAGNGVNPNSPAAHVLLADGSEGRPLPVRQTADGWQFLTSRAPRAGFIYTVDLSRTHSAEEDIRRYISTPIRGGVRVAGFEIFLEPAGVPVEDITVSIYNPKRIPTLIPWPALLQGPDLLAAPQTAAAHTDNEPIDNANAHLGQGQGFVPLEELAVVNGKTQLKLNEFESLNASIPVLENLIYHPHNLADLNNALLLCGNVRVETSQAKNCAIQFATDGEWKFADSYIVDLVRRIARTEIGFFGSAPTPQITVMLGTNEVTAEGGFDVYGVHTGSSVLVMVDRNTDWEVLEQQAASVIAHEMFHGWLGESIHQDKPSTMWFTEGATTWFAARMLTSAGIWSPEHARNILNTRLERDYIQSRLLGQISVADAAANVMSDADNVRFAYAGGVAACVGLDQWLTERSNKMRPLDEVLRHMYNNNDGTSLSREKLEAAVLQVTGIDCSQWLDTHVYGKTALPPIAHVI